MILDTSFVEDIGREDTDALRRAGELRSTGVPERISAMTVYELYWGVGYVDVPARERDRIEAVLETKEIYPVSPSIARKAGRIAGSLARDGSALDDPGDEIIGATGVVHEEPVLTRNVEHFERIADLEVHTY